MGLAWGIVLVLLSTLAWGGQTLSWLAPGVAERFGLTEREADVEPVFHSDGRGEAVWDFFTLWTLLAAGLLLVLDNSSWAYFGLLGGGIYIYFGGRGVVVRRVMEQRGYRIGSDSNVRIGYAFLVIWAVAGVVTVAAASVALS